jgi:hypothetical protein
MNKPLLQPPRRWPSLTRRELLLAIIAIGCATGWAYERVENRPSQDVQAVMEGMQEMKRSPDARVRVTVNFKGKYPILCDLTHLETPPPKQPQ